MGQRHYSLIDLPEYRIQNGKLNQGVDAPKASTKQYTITYRTSLVDISILALQ